MQISEAERLTHAIETAKAAAEQDGASAMAWHDLGVLYQRIGALAESRNAFEHAIAIDPALSSAHNNLGNTLTLMGDRERAVDSYRNATVHTPDLFPAHANAAAALHVLGRNTEALVHANRAVEIDSKSNAARITAAFIEGAVNGQAAGLAKIDELLETSPNELPAIAARAYILLRMERFAEALTTVYRGLALHPNYGLLLESLGCALRGLLRFPEAFATFDRAYELGHDRPSMLVLKGSGMLEVGDMSGAREAFEHALELAPDHASAWNALVELRDFEPNDPGIAKMETLLAESPVLRGLDARTIMHFALAKAYRKAGDRTNAFRHFGVGNALKRSTYAYDAAIDERFAADTIAFFTPEMMARLGGAGEPSRSPIFVVGMPRSGTSLVEQILASHPDVYGAGELTLFERAIAEAGADDMTALGRRYIELVDTIAPRNKRVVDKLPSNFRHVALIHLALPNARFIHTVRDPVDTCFSCYTTLFTGRQDFAFDLKEAGRYYRAYQALTEHWRTIMPPGIVLDVQYEELVADLEGNARRMLAFCGLAWDESVLTFYETSRPIRTASYAQARTPIYKTSVRAADAYRDELTPLIEALAGN